MFSGKREGVFVMLIFFTPFIREIRNLQQKRENKTKNRFTLSSVLEVSDILLLPYKRLISNWNPVKINKNAKLNAENKAIYLPVFPGLCFPYSRKVIRLAREEISVPTPPIFTPNNKSV